MNESAKDITRPISSRTRSRIVCHKPASVSPEKTIKQSLPVRKNTTKKTSGKKTASDFVDLTTTKKPVSAGGRGGRAKGTQKKKTKMAYAFQEPMDVDGGFVPNVVPPRTLPIGAPPGEEPDMCAVCMCEPQNPKKLDKCGHEFCTDCIDQCFKKMNPICPICGTVYGKMTGDMPPGSMQVFYDTHTQLPGYEGSGVIVIEYQFPDGIQTQEHPHPGLQYCGTRRIGYLPNNDEGRKVMGLLRRSFEARMTFTVGRSATTGLEDQVIWNDIHHKTRVHGGPSCFGYPDPTYLNRVQMELAAKGIK